MYISSVWWFCKWLLMWAVIKDFEELYVQHRMGVHFSVFYIVKSLFSLLVCFSVLMCFGLVFMFLSLGLATAGLAYVLIFFVFGIGNKKFRFELDFSWYDASVGKNNKLIFRNHFIRFMLHYLDRHYLQIFNRIRNHKPMGIILICSFGSTW